MTRKKNKRIISLLITAILFCTIISSAIFTVSANSLIGVVDYISGGNGTFWVRGWAFHTGNSSVSNGIHVYIGGPAGSSNAIGYDLGRMNLLRPDVNAVYGLPANSIHGYDRTITTSKTGLQDVYVYAINYVAGGNVFLGMSMVFITPTGTQPGFYSSQGGLANRNVTIQLTGTATTAPWNNIINGASTMWNSSGAGVNISTTTAPGPYAHVLIVRPETGVTWRGMCQKSPAGNIFATTSAIIINTLVVDNPSPTEPAPHNINLLRMSTVVHEFGHLFWLADSPNSGNAATLMFANRNRMSIFVPQVFDENNVRALYG